MKLLMKCKKAVIVTMSAITLLSSTAVMPVMAHGHGGGHHSSGYCTSVTVERSTGHHSDSHHNSSVKTKSSKKGTYCAYHKNLHSAAFQLAAQIVMKVFQPSTLCGKIVCKKLHYKAR